MAKPADKFFVAEFERLLLAAAAVIFEIKVYAVVINLGDAVVGDGHPVTKFIKYSSAQLCNGMGSYRFVNTYSSAAR